MNEQTGSLILRAGFSGPRQGMSNAQGEQLTIQLHRLSVRELHHGDCIGADAQAHVIARTLGLRIVGHPPTASGLRAYCEFDEIRPIEPFMARNHHIVQETAVLIATPDGPPRLRSGTWATIRYARRLTLPVIVIATDGSLEIENLTV